MDVTLSSDKHAPAPMGHDENVVPLDQEHRGNAQFLATCVLYAAAQVAADYRCDCGTPGCPAEQARDAIVARIKAMRVEVK